jgi:hypothetical protein
MPFRNELSNREGKCASPASHRNEFPAEYSLAGCSPAEPASASPAVLILQPRPPFRQSNAANGILHNPSVSHKRAHSKTTFDLVQAAQITIAAQNCTKPQPIRVTPEPGRNTLCPCGSNLKYKRCCANKRTQAAAA